MIKVPMQQSSGIHKVFTLQKKNFLLLLACVKTDTISEVSLHKANKQLTHTLIVLGVCRCVAHQ